MKFISFEFWKDLGTEISNPFQDEPLTEKSLYIWSYVSSPMMPCSFSHGAWYCFPSVKELSAFLKFKFMLFCFEQWLVRDEWDKNANHIISPEELFERAVESGKCRYLDDVPLMKKINEMLSEILKSEKEEIEKLLSIINQFNKKWENTGTWSFSLMLLKKPQNVGKEIYERVVTGITDQDEAGEEFLDTIGIDKKSWDNLCCNVLKDIESQNSFKKILDELEEC